MAPASANMVAFLGLYGCLRDATRRESRALTTEEVTCEKSE